MPHGSGRWMPVEIAQHRIALVARDTDNVAGKTAVDVERLLAGHRVGAQHRVLGARIGRPVGDAVVGVEPAIDRFAVMQRGEPVEIGLHPLRQRIIGRVHIGWLLDSIIDVSGILDRPLEPVVGRPVAPTRWRTMTVGVARTRVTLWVRIRISNTACPQTRLRDLAAQSARVLPGNSLPSDQRAQGMPGARCARSRAWCVGNTRVSHHRHTGITRHSPRNGLRLTSRSPRRPAIICTHLLPKVRGADSVDRLLILGGVDGVRIWTGTVWRPPPGKRGAVLHAALVEKPSCCIRRLGGRRSREVQFTRFLRNPSVTTDAMVGHAVELTAGRAAGRDIVVAQDTSELALGGPRARASGYGPVGKGGALGGLLLHAALALEVGSHALLGLVDAQIWNRDKGKAIARRSVRACRDRKIKGAAEDETELLFAHIDGLAETGRAGGGSAAAPGRQGGEAELWVGFL